MSIELRRIIVVSLVLGVLPSSAPASVQVEWDAERVTGLAVQLYQTVKGMRDQVRAVPRDIGSMEAASYYRLLDQLRVIERETRYLQRALISGEGREQTLPSYERIVSLRRDCAEDMRRLFLGAPALSRLGEAGELVKQMDPYYGFDPDRRKHLNTPRVSNP